MFLLATKPVKPPKRSGNRLNHVKFPTRKERIAYGLSWWHQV